MKFFLFLQADSCGGAIEFNGLNLFLSVEGIDNLGWRHRSRAGVAQTRVGEELSPIVKDSKRVPRPRNNLLDTGHGITTAFGAWGAGKMEYVNRDAHTQGIPRNCLRSCRSLRLNGLP
jgi:hypothetical protein